MFLEKEKGMFESLSDRLGSVFKKLKGHGKLSEKNIQDGLKEVRLALLEADVHYKVVKTLVAAIKERAVARRFWKASRPASRW